LFSISATAIWSSNLSSNISFHPFLHPIFLIVTALHYYCRVDDTKLESFEGLGIIPIDILQQGTKKIVEYMLDLF